MTKRGKKEETAQKNEQEFFELAPLAKQCQQVLTQFWNRKKMKEMWIP